MTLNGQLVDSYLNWLRERITTKHIDSVVEITTPFLDRHNDHLQIYVIPQRNNIKLTDDGYIISELLMSGCNVLSSRKRKESLITILNRFGVSISKDDELFIETTVDQFPQKKHMLLQAMLSVNNIFLTTKEPIEE